MKKIEISERHATYAKAVSLVMNYNNRVNKHLGVCAYALNNVIVDQEWKNSADFAQYLLDNDEPEAFLKFFGNKPFVLEEDMYKALKLRPESYAELLSDCYCFSWPKDRKGLIESFFEEFAPQLKQVPGSFLPDRYLSNKPLILKLLSKDSNYVIYLAEQDLEDAVKVNPKCLEHKTSKFTGSITLMRKLCAANLECAVYACSPITTKAGVKREDSNDEKKRKVNAWLTGTGERKALNNASGGGVVRVATPKNTPPKPKFKI